MLDFLIFLPLLYALIVWFLPSEKNVSSVSVFLFFLHGIYSLSLFSSFDPLSHEVQLVHQVPWISSFGIQYFIGIDGLSFWLVILTTFLMPLVALSSKNTIKNKTKGFFVSLFFLETALLGTFLSFDAILFYIFFEFSLIPMYFIIGVWGGKQRIQAALKFFIYTFTGSLFMLIGIIALIFFCKSTLGYYSASFIDFYKLHIPFVSGPFSLQSLLFLLFAFSFSIKMPVFPFHTWLPEAHVEAPTSGSVLLAGIMLKMGVYGFLRLCFPLFPNASEYWSWLFLSLALINIIYGALVAMIQSDLKKLVAYSSISHMGFILLGLFAFTNQSLTGSGYQMLNHGISTGALFLLVGMIYERTKTRKINNYGGLATKAPLYTVFFFIVLFSSIAVPFTNGFIGEFLILSGSFLTQPLFTSFAVLGVVLSAVYMLWMAKKIFFGSEGGAVLSLEPKSAFLTKSEIIVLTPFVVLIFLMGIFPNSFLKWSQASFDHLSENLHHYELTIQGGKK